MTELLTTATTGGPTADDADFERFYARWHPTVCRWAQAQYGVSLADEIAQETLSRAFVNFRQLRHEVPWPWLLTVARNVACDLYRAAARCSGQPAQDFADEPDPYPGPEELVLRSELSERVRDALSYLAVGDQQLLSMSIEDMSIAEMADALGASEGAVRVRLHRARKRLGSLYLTKGGNLAVTPIAVMAWTLRKLRRGLQQAVPVAAPTTALLAATATVATVGVVVAGLPAYVLPGRAIQSAAVQHHVAPATRAHHAVAADLRHGAVTGTVVGRPAPPATGPVTTPAMPVNAHASISHDPSRPGKVEKHQIDLSTPAGTVVVRGFDIRETGSGLACRRAHALC